MRHSCLVNIEDICQGLLGELIRNAKLGDASMDGALETPACFGSAHLTASWFAFHAQLIDHRSSFVNDKQQATFMLTRHRPMVYLKFHEERS